MQSQDNAKPGCGEFCRWRDIAITPTSPVQVEFFLGNAIWTDSRTGEVCPAAAEAPHDSRREIAYWDGVCWRELGTNHEFYESWKDPMSLPTHWRPLPPIPDGYAVGPPTEPVNPGTASNTDPHPNTVAVAPGEAGRG